MAQRHGGLKDPEGRRSKGSNAATSARRPSSFRWEAPILPSCLPPERNPGVPVKTQGASLLWPTHSRKRCEFRQAGPRRRSHQRRTRRARSVFHLEGLPTRSSAKNSRPRNE